MTAKPLIAGRLAFPGEPRFDPGRYFDRRSLERYVSPILFGMQGFTRIMTARCLR